MKFLFTNQGQCIVNAEGLFWVFGEEIGKKKNNSSGHLILICCKKENLEFFLSKFNRWPLGQLANPKAPLLPDYLTRRRIVQKVL